MVRPLAWGRMEQSYTRCFHKGTGDSSLGPYASALNHYTISAAPGPGILKDRITVDQLLTGLPKNGSEDKLRSGVWLCVLTVAQL